MLQSKFDNRLIVQPEIKSKNFCRKSEFLGLISKIVCVDVRIIIDYSWFARMERRSARKFRVIKDAEIICSSVLLKGVVLNLSANGAWIHLLSPSEVPDEVVLRLPYGVIRTARRRWQRGSEVGLKI